MALGPSSPSHKLAVALRGVRISANMRARLTITTLATLLFAIGCLAGCERALFPDNLPRSPFERYGTLRGRHRPESDQTTLGWDKPALRERLKPLSQP